MREPLAGLAEALKNQDRDTVIFGILIISVFTAMILGVPPTKATLAGCLFLGLYVLARFVLMHVRVRELQLLFRRDIGSDAAKLIENHATDEEKKALAQISTSSPRRRTRTGQTTGAKNG